MSTPSRIGNVEFVQKVVDEMAKKSVEWTPKTYNLLLTAYSRRKDYKTANGYFADMKEKGIAPDAQLYNTMINLHARGGRTSDALSLLKDSVSQDCVCNWKTFQIVLQSAVNADSMQMAQEVLDVAKEAKVEGIKHLYDDIIQAHACRDDIKAIRRLIDEMQASGIYVRPFCLEMLAQFEERDRINELE